MREEWKIKKRFTLFKKQVFFPLLRKRKRVYKTANFQVSIAKPSFSLGATRTRDARELLYARQKVVVTTKAFGLQAIDLVYIDYKDVEGLRQQAREGALMGFTGKDSVLFLSS